MFEDRIGADASGDEPTAHFAVPRDTAVRLVTGGLVCGPDGPDAPLDDDDDRYQSLDPVGAADPREQWSDEQWMVAIEQWAAADPDQRPRPSVAEVLTAAGRDRVGPQT